MKVTQEQQIAELKQALEAAESRETWISIELEIATRKKAEALAALENLGDMIESRIHISQMTEKEFECLRKAREIDNS